MKNKAKKYQDELTGAIFESQTKRFHLVREVIQTALANRTPVQIIANDEKRAWEGWRMLSVETPSTGLLMVGDRGSKLSKGVLIVQLSDFHHQ